MKHVSLIALSLLAAITFTGRILAQDSPAWRVVLLRADVDARELIVVTDAGIGQPIPLAQGFDVGIAGLKLSPDGRYAATLAPTRDAVLLTDLQAGSCCTTLTFAERAPTAASVAGFSPDSLQVAVAYFVESPYKAELVALDVADGTIAARTDVAPADTQGDGVSYPVVDSWRDDGVTFWTACKNCTTAGSDDSLLTWNPATGAFGASDLSRDGAGDTLTLTGEQIAPRYSTLYPAAPMTDEQADSAAPAGKRNVVVLSGSRATQGHDVVYFDPNNLDLDSARWIADGNAFLVFATADQGASLLMTADAPPQPISFGAHQFLAGTPDGWLTLEAGALYHYVLADGAATRNALGTLAGFVTLVERTPLGASATATFAPIPAPKPQACPGGMEPRLTPGHEGRVTPGAANNVREQPTTRSLIVGKIAGGDSFTVVSGPVCAQGLTWWQVQFRDITGWTVEGNDGGYWLEPAE